MRTVRIPVACAQARTAAARATGPDIFKNRIYVSCVCYGCGKIMCMYSYLYYNEGKRSGCEYGAAPLSLPARLPRRPALGDVRSDEGGGGVRLGIVTKEHRCLHAFPATSVKRRCHRGHREGKPLRCQLHKLRRLELLRPQAQHLLGRRLFGGGQQRLEGDAEHHSPGQGRDTSLSRLRAAGGRRGGEGGTACLSCDVSRAAPLLEGELEQPANPNPNPNPDPNLCSKASLSSPSS